MKVKKLDRSVLDELRNAMNEALAPVGEKYGLSIHVGNCSYRNLEATWKTKTSVLDAEGAEKQAKEDFIMYGEIHGFAEEDFGASFKDYSGEEFKIIGWLPRRRKYPIQVVSTTTGKRYIFPITRVLMGLGKEMSSLRR